MLTADEKKAHDEGMTGSKIARIITGKFGGAFQVWHEMKGLYSPPKEYSRFIEIGTALEPVIIHDYEETTGHRVCSISTVYAKDDPWCRVHIDGKIMADEYASFGVIEAKAANVAIASRDWSDGNIPHYPIVQAMFGMYCTGYKWASIGSITGLYTIEHHTIERDDELIEMILAHAHHFRSLLDLDTPPPADGSLSTSDIIKHVYHKAELDMFTVGTPDVLELAQKLHAVKAIEKVITNEKARLENVFKMHIQNHDGVHIPGFGSLTWKNTNPKPSTAFNEMYLKHRYPEIHAECTQTYTRPSHRMFLVKPDPELAPKLPESIAVNLSTGEIETPLKRALLTVLAPRTEEEASEPQTKGAAQ